MADDVRHKIRIVLWVGEENKAEWGPDCPGHTEWKHTLSQVDPVLVKRPFFLPYVAFRDFGDYCDVFGNLLAILFDVANPAQEKRILDYLHQVGIAEPYPVRVLNPVIHPGNKDWREYYRNNNLNLPEQYHNGGIWPFVGGFYVAALVKAGRMDEARHQLEKLAEVNRQGVEEEWEFNEWCHGRTGRPMGYPHQAWSAGMYVFAYHCVEQGRVPISRPITSTLWQRYRSHDMRDPIQALAEAIQQQQPVAPWTSSRCPPEHDAAGDRRGDPGRMIAVRRGGRGHVGRVDQMSRWRDICP